jgi:hypothetical protein
VAAHGADNCRASFSNYGTWVSITAPGVDILSTVPNGAGTNGFELLSGTSMASPFVAGAAAVVWAKNPTFTNSQITDLLTLETSDVLLNRNGTCWPSDGSTFQRLSLFHAIDTPIYEACSWGDVIGYAVDAETGEPLLGAKVTTQVGTTITGTDYVPYYGEHTDPFYDNSMIYVEGYGMFHVRSDTPDPATSLTIQKTKYAKPVFNNINVPSCFFNDIGVLPVAPNRPLYWLVITWNYGTTPNGYYSLLRMPDSSLVYWLAMGDLNTAPYAKLLWNSWYWVLGVGADEDLRAFSEVIRIKKTLPGTYKYFVGEIYGTPDTWSALGIKAYIYKYVAGTSKLVKTYTPPAGVGTYWYIADITGSTITDVNTMTNTEP